MTMGDCCCDVGVCQDGEATSALRPGIGDWSGLGGAAACTPAQGALTPRWHGLGDLSPTEMALLRAPGLAAARAMWACVTLLPGPGLAGTCCSAGRAAGRKGVGRAPRPRSLQGAMGIGSCTPTEGSCGAGLAERSVRTGAAQGTCRGAGGSRIRLGAGLAERSPRSPPMKTERAALGLIDLMAYSPLSPFRRGRTWLPT